MKAAPPHPAGPPRSPRSALFVSAALALITLGLYWPVRHFELISYDDPEYVTWNVDIQGGLSLPALRWAFSTGYAGNWHPLTWLSYMLDYQLFGGSPGQMHLTNLFLHLANNLLLFALFRRMTGALWRSAFVAAVFALHPLHVESVAWVCERKDVLSTFFGLLALLAYHRYVTSIGCRVVRGERLEAKGPRFKSSLPPPPLTLWPAHPALWYWAALVLFACSLMSKPMLVTLPCLLLLLDYWPLGRFRPFSKLIVVEKLPFLALAIADSAVTFLAQKAGGAIVPTEALPLPARLANALMAYWHYLRDALWPAGLSICYPAHSTWPPLPLLLTGALLAGLTAVVFRQYKRPFLLTGWCWFLGTLVPVIGLVQTGAQTIADRFTYFPLVGLSICFAWGAFDLVLRRPAYKTIVVVSTTGALCLCATMTSRQVSFWKDSLAVFTRALAVTSDNFVAHDHVGMALSKLGRHDEALQHYQEAVRLNPTYENAYIGLAATLGNQGHLQEAQTYALKALALKPDLPEAHDCLGVALQLQGKSAEAAAQFSEAVRVRPAFTEARLHWSYPLLQQGKIDEAIAQLREALRYQPDSAEIQQRLGYALSQKASADQPVPPKP